MKCWVVNGVRSLNRNADEPRRGFDVVVVAKPSISRWAVGSNADFVAFQRAHVNYS
jgi:hypothetical protein